MDVPRHTRSSARSSRLRKAERLIEQRPTCGTLCGTRITYEVKRVKREIGRIRAVYDRIGTPVKPSLEQGHSKFRVQLFGARRTSMKVHPAGLSLIVFGILHGSGTRWRATWCE